MYSSTNETKQTVTPDGPIEDEATAREKFEAAYYDPDNVSEITFMKTMKRKSGPDVIDNMTPLIHFCSKGDMKMVRYLYYCKGASMTEPSPKGYFFPLFMASMEGNLELCKWLYEHGAEKDIQRITRRNPRTPARL